MDHNFNLMKFKFTICDKLIIFWFSCFTKKILAVKYFFEKPIYLDPQWTIVFYGLETKRNYCLFIFTSRYDDKCIDNGSLNLVPIFVTHHFGILQTQLTEDVLWPSWWGTVAKKIYKVLLLLIIPGEYIRERCVVYMS